MNAKALSLLLITLMGCVTPPVKLARAAAEEDYKDFAASGTCLIAGEAFHRTKPGEAAPDTPLNVHLDPVTPYSTELYQALRAKGELHKANEDDTVAPDPVMLKHRRTVQTNPRGRFEFSEVAPGDYYLACYLSESVGNFRAGTWKVQRIRIRSGQIVEGIVLK